MNKKTYYTLYVLRLVLAFIFLWAFFDKSFGLGFSTAPSNAWIRGGSPTGFYLKNVSYGPLSPLYKVIGGHPLTDGLFMLALLGIGVGLLVPRARKITAWSGFALMMLMWTSQFPPKTNPLLDDHIVYALLFLLTLFNPYPNKSAHIK